MEKNTPIELDFLGSSRWPKELRQEVVKHLSPKDLLLCRLVCPKWLEELRTEASFWKAKIPAPLTINTLSDDNYYRFFTRGGVDLIQSLDHVKLFINPDDLACNCISYLHEARFGQDLGYRYMKTKKADYGNNLDNMRNLIATTLELKCPYLATPTKYFEDADDIYLIFDNQFEGLNDFINSMPLGSYNEEVVTTLVPQLIQATQSLHSRGLRLIESYSGVDFAIRKNYLNEIQLLVFKYAAEQETMSHSSYHFMSPERINLEDTDLKSDLFSLGSLAYYLLKRVPLYNFNPMRALYLLGSFENYQFDDPNNQISDLAKDFIQRFLKLKPYDRMTLKEALKHPWLKKASGSS